MTASIAGESLIVAYHNLCEAGAHDRWARWRFGRAHCEQIADEGAVGGALLVPDHQLVRVGLSEVGRGMSQGHLPQSRNIGLHSRSQRGWVT